MKTLTNNWLGDVKLFADTTLKTWLACGLVIIGIKEIKVTCVVLAIMALRAALRGQDPVYLGLSSKAVQESRIVKYGLPVALALSLALLVQATYFYQ